MRVKIANSARERLRGLLGRKDFPDILLLAPCNDIHTFGMKRAIDVAFITSDGTVLESHCAVGARRRLRCRSAAATLERFSVDEPWFSRGDRIELKHYVRDNL